MEYTSLLFRYSELCAKDLCTPETDSEDCETWEHVATYKGDIETVLVFFGIRGREIGGDSPHSVHSLYFCQKGAGKGEGGYVAVLILYACM